MTRRPSFVSRSVPHWALLTLLGMATLAHAQHGTKGGEWRAWGGDNGGTKYSPLDQINKSNVAELKVAWTAENMDKSIEGQHPSGRPENTPLMVGDTVYNSSGLALLSAIDAATGKTKWIFDPKGYKAGQPGNLGFVHRGFAYWTDGKEERLFIAPHDATLWAVDAKTGKAISDFGDAGKVDLTKAIPRAVKPRNYTETSPPVICKDVVMMGSSVGDGAPNKEAPRGDIQAFDVRTGKPLWVFHSIPQEGEFGNDTWENDSWKYTGNTNVWTCFTADDELGYVYLPFGTPTNDWYGGHRLGNNLFGESLVCLDVKTGKRVWHFQTVHHGLWDYDLPGAPVLCDIKVNGKPIKAVAQLTKTGFTWVFDRATGEPVWPIEERPVPQSTVPGERTSPTQPIPTKPAPYELQGTYEENLIDFTPELKAEALEILNKFDHGSMFTPPSERGTLNLPGWGGGGNWWGAAFDPETSLFYVPSVTSPIVVKLVKPDPSRTNFDWVRGGAMGASGPRGLPLFKPPWGRITAINLNTGDHAWQIPHGDGPRARVSEVVGRDVGPLGAGGGGPLLTKTLLFAAQGLGGRGSTAENSGSVLRAFDKTDGKVVAEVKLPGRPASGSPITYMASGKQYIAIAMSDGSLVALNLP